MSELFNQVGDLVKEFLNIFLSFFDYVISTFGIFDDIIGVFTGNIYLNYIGDLLNALFILLIIHFLRKLFE